MPKACKYKPYVLPSKFNELEAYIQENKQVMTEQVICSIEYALDNNLNYIEVFCFKESDFVITIPFTEFYTNLENIFKYCIEHEKYELCSKIKTLKEKINFKLDHVITNEKTQKYKK